MIIIKIFVVTIKNNKNIQFDHENTNNKILVSSLWQYNNPVMIIVIMTVIVIKKKK